MREDPEPPRPRAADWVLCKSERREGEVLRTLAPPVQGSATSLYSVLNDLASHFTPTPFPGFSSPSPTRPPGLLAAFEGSAVSV